MKKLVLIMILCFDLFASEGLRLKQEKEIPIFVEKEGRFKACFSGGEFANELSSGAVEMKEDEQGLNPYCCIKGEVNDREGLSKIKKLDIDLVIDTTSWTEREVSSFMFFKANSRYLKAGPSKITLTNHAEQTETTLIDSLICSPGLFNKTSFGPADVKEQFGSFFEVHSGPARHTASASP